MALTPIETDSLPAGDLSIASLAVTGGTLYIAAVRQQGQGPAGVTSSFVGAAAGGATRYLSLTNAKSDLGVPLTAAAGTPTGAVGVARTAGTSLALVGEATSGSAKTNKAFFETNLPDTYIANANIPVTINASIGGTGTLTAASCTMTLTAYSEVNGVETALTVSSAGTIVAAGSNLPFTITGTGLAPGAHIGIEATMLITSSSGANTGTINTVSFVA